MADFHTHPYVEGHVGVSFSGGDIFGAADMVNVLGANASKGFVRFVEAGSMRFALEVDNVDQARQFVNSNSYSGLIGYFNNVLITSVPGSDFSERSRNAVKEYLKNNPTGLKYYESYDKDKVKFREVK